MPVAGVRRQFGGFYALGRSKYHRVMSLPVFHVDAFTSKPFAGNPAAVCPLAGWLDDGLLQAVAAENNLSETAFFVPRGDHYELRWFTPRCEAKLCGHATLASAFVLLHILGTKYEREEEVKEIRPNFLLLEKLHPAGVAVTAPGEQSDFVSRYFAPSYGIPEDPVTGSTHCSLAPYWTQRLGKTSLHALQISERGGELWCEVQGDRVILKGNAVLTLRGELLI